MTLWCLRSNLCRKKTMVCRHVIVIKDKNKINTTRSTWAQLCYHLRRSDEEQPKVTWPKWRKSHDQEMTSPEVTWLFPRTFSPVLSRKKSSVLFPVLLFPVLFYPTFFTLLFFLYFFPVLFFLTFFPVLFSSFFFRTFLFLYFFIFYFVLFYIFFRVLFHNFFGTFSK